MQHDTSPCSLPHLLFFFKQKTAYEFKECDWSSDVCSSDLIEHDAAVIAAGGHETVVVGRTQSLAHLRWYIDPALGIQGVPVAACK